MQIDVMAVLNDTTGTLMSCAYKKHNCRVGLIAGKAKGLLQNSFRLRFYHRNIILFHVNTLLHGLGWGISIISPYTAIFNVFALYFANNLQPRLRIVIRIAGEAELFIYWCCRHAEMELFNYPSSASLFPRARWKNSFLCFVHFNFQWRHQSM
jgi:hypothetical protein